MIKKAFLLLNFLILCTLSSHTQATTSILLLGDSLSASYGMQQNEGWVHLLNQTFQAENTGYKIVNASISGETTGGGLSRLPGILSKQSFDHLIIELGGNDGLRGFPPVTIKHNLLQIIRLAQAQDIDVYIMEIQIPPNYGPRYSKMFTDVFATVAEEAQITLLPFFLTDIAIKPELMQNDGIHPNKKAQPLIARTMKEVIEREIIKLAKQ
ncbi:arylesterase [Thalassotalea sp. LPB0316]|uniref:arylesterase n=1 Tax=Thalassotalea sp. LPB0316 TaxID=2769490 RepID=UPI001867E546|nr:arylesterase [Thalassotalea sp. LPB0316]QOL24762.1 arylesterase [Thalassotalea sp. LPB0316]